jgi:predicted nucleic acid-binding protein
MRIFLDANIIFSAAKSDGAIRELLTLLERSGHACWADGYVIEEARRNIPAKAPARMPALEDLLPHLKTTSTRRVDSALEASLRSLPAKDRPVLAAASLGDCDALVTGDRTHFGTLYGRTIHGVTIHTPRSLAEALLR